MEVSLFKGYKFTYDTLVMVQAKLELELIFKINNRGCKLDPHLKSLQYYDIIRQT